MIGTALVVLALLPVLTLFLLARSARHRGSGLMKALLWLTVVHEILLVCWPVLYTVAVDYRLEREYSLRLDTLVAVLAGEAVFVAMFACGFLSLGPLSARLTVPRGRTSHSADWAFIYVLTLVGLAIQLVKFSTPMTSYADLTQHAELTVPDSWAGIVWGWTKGALNFPGLVAATVSLLAPRVPLWLRGAGLATLLAVAGTGIAGGVRGGAIWVISLMVVVALLYERRRVVVIAGILLIVFVPISPFLTGTFRSIAYSELTGESRVEALSRIKEQFTNSDSRVQTDDEGVIDNFYRRAQGPRNSTVLYGLHDKGDGAGLRPIEGALLLPVPRALWPEKPPAGSIDETNYGQAIFLVRRIGYGAPLYNMGSVLASAHAYWEGGWAWLVIAGALTGAFWRVAVLWSDRNDEQIALVFGLTFGSALLIDGFMTMMYPVYTLIDIVWSSILPLALLRVALSLGWTAVASMVATGASAVRDTSTPAIPPH